MKVGERVRLLEAFDGLHVGSEGRVAGYYRRATGEHIAVAFDSGRRVAVPDGMLSLLPEASPAARDQPRPGEDTPRHLTW